MIKLLIIDNYDSFTYNLVHLFGALPDVNVKVVRNDDDFILELEKGGIDGVIISPGPGTPLDKEYFGKNDEVINRFGKQGLPILGICLGFQGIAVAFGAELKEAPLPQHGKASALKIIKNGRILAGVPDGIKVMRYHSLMLDAAKTIPAELDILAESKPGSPSIELNGREVMAVEHKEYPIYGLQFHPESYATELGNIIAGNFVNIIKELQA
ncbi:MAG TPA: aminodeoxychorismate/anthranilate synthase component II [Candidatus Saccharimonadales bacterium]|nr:aminodeoxychorismate/anthranilate synthase component II [Candidatus Saccharimonadales bacterium]